MEEGLADSNGNTITKMRGSKNLSFCWEWCVPAQKTVTNPKPEQNNCKFRTNVWTLLIGN